MGLHPSYVLLDMHTDRWPDKNKLLRWYKWEVVSLCYDKSYRHYFSPSTNILRPTHDLNVESNPNIWKSIPHIYYGILAYRGENYGAWNNRLLHEHSGNRNVITFELERIRDIFCVRWNAWCNIVPCRSHISKLKHTSSPINVTLKLTCRPIYSSYYSLHIWLHFQSTFDYWARSCRYIWTRWIQLEIVNCSRMCGTILRSFSSFRRKALLCTES